MTSRILLVSIVTLSGLFVVQQRADAASYRHVDVLALRIKANSTKLYHEFRLHYRHTPEYQHLVSDSRGLISRSDHIHQLAHRHGSLRHMASDLRALDRWFHHLERVLHDLEFDTDHGQFGHAHGPTRHVHSLMKLVKVDIHHLRAEIEAMADSCDGGSIHVRQYDRQVSLRAIGSSNHRGIRSNWTVGLNNLDQARSRIVRRVR